jgi:hypothetical protein
MPNDYPPDGNPRQTSGAGGPGSHPAGAQHVPGGVFGVLQIVVGNDRGKHYSLQLSQTSIGRGADQDLVLADISVSRRHIRITIEGDRYRVTDLGSGNGTLVNGVRTESALLNDGDQIAIGNTVLRLDHAPSRAIAPTAAPIAQANPDNKTLIGDAVNFPLPPPASPPPYAAPAYPPASHTPASAPPSHPVAAVPSGYSTPPMVPAVQPIDPRIGAMNPGMAVDPLVHSPGARPVRPPVDGRRSSGGLLDTPLKKVAAFGGAALVALLIGGLVVSQFFSSSAAAKKSFAQGQKAFTEGEFTTARQLFSAALEADPELSQAAKFIKQCDLELLAQNKLKNANLLAATKRWVEVIKILDSIDRTSKVYRQAEELRRTAVPEAIEQYLAEAKELMKGDPEAARSRVELALELDPESEEASEMERQLKAEPAAPPTEAQGKLVKQPKPQPIKSAKSINKDKSGQRATSLASPRDTNDSRLPAATNPTAILVQTPGGAKPSTTALPPITPQPSASAGSASGTFDLLTSPAGGPYRSKDFGGAAQALRNIKGPQQRNAESAASQVMQLQQFFTKAESDRNPSTAIPSYQQALGIDAKLAKGFHGAYFKSQLGKLSKALAQQAFQQGKYDVAFDAAQNCAKYGTDDGGVQAQLKIKAAQLLSQAEGLKQRDLNGAKNLWRTITRMVPPSDPSYARASQGLNSSQAKRGDEDE